MRNSDNSSNTEREYYNNQNDSRFGYNRNYNNNFYSANNQNENRSNYHSNYNNDFYGANTQYNNNNYPINNNYNARGYNNNNFTNNYGNNLHNQNRFDNDKIYVKSRKKRSVIPIIVLFSPIFFMFFLMGIIVITCLLSAESKLLFTILKALPILFIVGLLIIALYSFINETKQRLSRKRNCQYKLKGLITDVRTVRKSSNLYYIPTIMYSFKGKEYIIKDDKKYFTQFKAGAKIDMAINQNEPEEFYIAMLEEGQNFPNILGSIIVIVFAIIFIIFINNKF